jgi:hypothetical protein
MAENTNRKPRAKRTTAAPAAPPTTPDEAALRKEAATARLVEADAALKALRAAVRGGDTEAVRAAADELAGAGQGVRGLYSVRKSGTTPRPRTVPGHGEYVIVVDGRIVKDSAYKPSVTRDVAMAKKRIRDGEARPATERYVGDEVMAQGKVMTRAEAAEAGVTS